MKSVNILFSGDSFTEGTELEGVKKDFKYRSENRFSHLVSKDLGLTYDNIGISGNSNDWIVRDTITWLENNKCDLAVVQFSHPQRWYWYDDNKRQWWNMDRFEHMEMHPHKPLVRGCKVWDDNLKSYSHYIDNYFKNVFLLENYLENNGIPYIFCQLEEQPESQLINADTPWRAHVKNHPIMGITPAKHLDRPIGFYPGETDALLDTWWTEDRFLEYRCEDLRHIPGDNVFLGGWHPNENGHRKVADWIIEEINQNFKGTWS